MSKKEQYIAAIDIGTTKIVAIVGKKNENGKIEILANKGITEKPVFIVNPDNPGIIVSHDYSASF